jgi:hypothetical protein
MNGELGAGATWLRAGVVAGVALLLGLAGHVSAGGGPPSPAALGVMLVLGTLLALPVVRRRVGPAALAGLMVVEQTAVQVGSSLLHDHRLASMPSPPAGVPAACAGHSQAELSGYALVLTAHLMVAALAVLWLGRGEPHLGAQLALLVGPLLRVLALVRRVLRVERPRRVAQTPWSDLVPGPRWLVAPAAHRGPPLAV